RVGRDTSSIWRFQAPSLPAQELPLAALQIQPIKPQAIGVGVGCDKLIGGIVAVEVSLDVTLHVVGAELGGYTHIESRILSRGTELGEMSLDCIAERDQVVIGAGDVTRVCGTKDVFKINKAAGREFRATDTERKRRSFRSLLHVRVH